MNHIQIRFTHVLAIFLLMGFFGVAQAGNDKNYTYSVISGNEYKNYKRSIDVRLNKKVSKQDLRSIAEKLKKSEKKKYERIFIAYYLPNMKVGSGAWATSHFNPKLKIEILGLTLEEEAKATQQAKSNSTGAVGIWMDDRPYIGATITIRRKAGKLYLETKYKDGSGSNEEMTETKSGSGIKLVEKGGNSHGEYYILDKNKDLHAGGNEGIFLKYKKIK